jgi:hypothetical protein
MTQVRSLSNSGLALRHSAGRRRDAHPVSMAR